MEKIRYIILKFIRIIYRKLSKKTWYTEEYVQLFNQEANDYIKDKIKTSKNGLMIAKFGTYELETMLYSLLDNHNFAASIDMIKCHRSIFFTDIKKHLPNMGFFPTDEKYLEKFSKLYLNDIKEIDILASYICTEHYLSKELQNVKKVNLEGYYAPFLWKNPWTYELKNKKVLVIHPFTDTIKSQYEKRKFLFKDENFLPDFKELLLLKSVQSIANNIPTEFSDWYEALDYMKSEIDKLDFDIALIGCGAYGLPLAAHIKRMNKIAIHTAGWTQILFGIYGERWLEDEKYKGFINEHWVRPSENEKPKQFSTIEKGCYW